MLCVVMLDDAQQDRRRTQPSFVTFVLAGSLAQLCMSALLVGGLFISSELSASTHAGLQLTCGASALLTIASVAVALSMVGREVADPSRPLTFVLRFGAPLATLAAWWFFMPAGADSASADQLLQLVLPTAALGWAAALLVSVLLRQSLRSHQHQLRARYGSADSVAGGRTENLSDDLGRLGGYVALAIALIIVSMFLAHVDAAYLRARPFTTSLVAFLVIGSIGLGYAAGRFFGEVYARTLSSVTARFEQLASESVLEANQPLRTPVVEAFGGLFAELERLRIHLTDEISIYEQALEKTRVAHHEKEQFLAAVSHELRTPLNSICGFAHLMLEDTAGDLTAAQREDLRLVRAGGHQLLALIDDIVDVTMVETGEFSLSLEEEELVPRIREIVSIHRPLVHNRAIQLEFEVRGPARRITCDGRRIGQVITNLLSNAIKFTEQGSVTVSCDFGADDGSLTIEVKDTGVGIGEDGLNVVFEAYKQVGEIKKRSRGTGLGLAISRAVVERHGGEIWATSSLGEGSSFFARLPQVARPASPASSPDDVGGDERD